MPLQGLEKVKKGLFSRLHDIARAEIFPNAMMASTRDASPPVKAEVKEELVAQAAEHTRDDGHLFREAFLSQSGRPQD